MRLYNSKKAALRFKNAFLSFDEIKKEEGIYVPSDRTLAGYRLIVICTGDLAQVLVYNGIANDVYPAATAAWVGKSFMKTPEKLELVFHP